MKFSREEIDEAIRRLVWQYNLYWKEKEPLLIGVGRGGARFFFEFLRRVDSVHSIDYDLILVHRYNMMKGQAAVSLDSEMPSVAGRNVILFDDLIHEGVTLRYVRNTLLVRGAQTVDFITLLAHQRARLDVPEGVRLLYGLELNPSCGWLVGFGMDWNSGYRNLNAIYELEMRG